MVGKHQKEHGKVGPRNFLCRNLLVGYYNEKLVSGISVSIFKSKAKIDKKNIARISPTNSIIDPTCSSSRTEEINLVNVPKERRTYCKDMKCRKFALHKVTQY